MMARSNAIDSNLAPFFKHRGKLLIYTKLGPVGDSFRLFMVPDMAHCGVADGGSNFDMLGVIDQWTEQKKAAESIVASHGTIGVVERTQPLCVYPQKALYKGTGSIDDATSFLESSNFVVVVPYSYHDAQEFGTSSTYRIDSGNSCSGVELDF
jgi:hypothetical protein